MGDRGTGCRGRAYRGYGPDLAPDADPAAIPADFVHLRRVNRELLATVADLRATVERQQAHIEKLVRMTLGRQSEKLPGPNLFDGTPIPTYRPRATPRRAQPRCPATAPRASAGMAAGPGRRISAVQSSGLYRVLRQSAGGLLPRFLFYIFQSVRLGPLAHLSSVRNDWLALLEYHLSLPRITSTRVKRERVLQERGRGRQGPPRPVELLAVAPVSGGGNLLGRRRSLRIPMRPEPTILTGIARLPSDPRH